MKAFLQPLQGRLLQSSIAAFERNAARYDWNWHYHPEIELTWIRKGTGTRLVGDHVADYGPDDLILLGSNLPHTWFSKPARQPEPDANKAVVAFFRPGILPESLLSLPEFSAISKLLEMAHLGVQFTERVAQEIGANLLELTVARGLTAWSGLIAVLDRLACQKSFKTLSSSNYQHRRSYQLNTRLERVIAFMDKNFREDLSLEKAARIAGLCHGAFSRFFKKMTRKTFVDYRNTRRIRETCRLLEESTDMSITEIAYECGFENLSNFNRRFREQKGMAPHGNIGRSTALPPRWRSLINFRRGKS